MELLERHFDIALETPDGIKKLRELILTLAMKGKLVKQNEKDQSALELLNEIEIHKQKQIRDGKIKKQDILPPIKPEDVPYELPMGWAWCRFGSITINRDAERIPITKDDRVSIQGVYDYYGASGVIDKVDNYIFEKDLLLIGEDGANLVNRSTPIAFIAHGKYWVNNHAHVIDSISFDLLKYLENYINSIDLKPYVTGTAQPKMNQAKMNSILIALPPLAEQKRIVERIDQLMTLCDKLEAERNERDKSKIKIHSTAMNRLLSAPDSTAFNSSWSFITKHFSELYSVTQNVDELKKAILQLAVMGKLVPQDVNDQPASELLKEIEAEKQRLIKDGSNSTSLSSRIKKQESLPPIKSEEIPYEIPAGWAWARLGKVIRVTSGNMLSKDKMQPGGIPVFGGNGITGYHNEYNTNCRTVVIGRVGFYCGSVHLTPEKAWITDNAFFTNFDERLLYQPFVICLLKATNLQNDTSSTAQPVISGSKIYPLLLAIPPFNEQKRIVKKIEQLFELCNSLEQQIKDSTGKKSEILEAVLSRV